MNTSGVICSLELPYAGVHEHCRHDQTCYQCLMRTQRTVMSSTSSRPPTPTRSVALIGAGAVGLPCARHLREVGLDVRVFERQSGVGGIWNWSPDAGRPLSVPTPPPSRAAFEPRHGRRPAGAYTITDHVDKERQLARPSNPVYWTLSNNVPTTTMAVRSRRTQCFPLMCQFKDFAYPDGTPENIPHTRIASYLHAYAEHFGLQPLISFDTRVELAEKREGCWTLMLRRLSDTARGLEEELWTEVGADKVQGCLLTLQTFDALVVATGHYNAPYIPHIPGVDSWAARFPERVLHTQNYRSPLGFEAGASARHPAEPKLTVAEHFDRRLRDFGHRCRSRPCPARHHAMDQRTRVGPRPRRLPENAR